ncbi:biosynthetic-type acetolactate synthase large subunit [Candidatus Peregrinibacteria bacterium]|nr:biosynthetic-type acetolactate synthase large subunit [Candidatus Peregrinibacteria bacterium]
MTHHPLKPGSDIFCEALAQEDVELMFGIPGGVVVPLYDKINKYGHRIRHILPRQEQGGGFAADGYARVTGKAGVALGTSGPGATNLMTSIANSMMDSVPTVYVTGQVTEGLIGTDAFQETDVIGMTMPIVKHSYFVNHAQDIRRVIKEAFYIASTGRPGPVHIDFAKDAWLSTAPDDTNVTMDLPGYQPIPERCSDGDIQRLEKLLERDGVKPVIIAGHGAELSGAHHELLEFAERHHIPVTSTLLGLCAFPQWHHQWIGMVGMHGDAVANFTVNAATLVISIGSRFDDRITGKVSAFIQGKTFAHFEIDPSEIGKNVPIDLPLSGDIRDSLTRANKLLSSHRFDAWWQWIEAQKERYGFLDFTLNPEKNTRDLSQPRLIQMLSDMTRGEAIVASDVGRNQMWTARFYRFKHPRSYLSSGGLGSMGYGLPAAIGAKLGLPEREVWAVSGDGGFMMNAQEMATLMAYNIPVKMMVMEDGALGMVRQWQNLLFDKNISHTDLKNPDFVALAAAFGIPAWRARTYTEAAQGIEKARQAKGSALVICHVDPDEYILPMIPPNAALGDQCLREEDFKRSG